MKKNGAIALFVLSFLALFLLLLANGKSTSSNTAFEDNEAVEIGTGNEKDIEPVAVNESTAIPDSILEFCSPAPLIKVPEQIVKKKAYIVSYNKDTKTPNWVAWYLSGEHADGPIGRSKNFYEDEVVPKPRATLEDYKKSGWSRGHMCPAGDNKWDEEAMRESFSLINVCPQNASLNSGLWNRLEMDCRQWAKRFHGIYIVCGPIYYRQDHEIIGQNRVVVPEAFFKVILCLYGEPKGLGIIVKNNAGEKKKDLYFNSIDQVERITGFDFYPNLPDDVEEKVESYINMDLWK